MIFENNTVLRLIEFPKPQTNLLIHLQWFAAEDEGRTEDPSEYKIRKAREEGKVARSAELTSAIVLLFGIATIGILSSYILKIFACSALLSSCINPRAYFNLSILYQ